MARIRATAQPQDAEPRDKRFSFKVNSFHYSSTSCPRWRLTSPMFPFSFFCLTFFFATIVDVLIIQFMQTVRSMHRNNAPTATFAQVIFAHTEERYGQNANGENFLCVCQNIQDVEVDGTRSLPLHPWRTSIHIVKAKIMIRFTLPIDSSALPVYPPISIYSLTEIHLFRLKSARWSYS